MLHSFFFFCDKDHLTQVFGTTLFPPQWVGCVAHCVSSGQRGSCDIDATVYPGNGSNKISCLSPLRPWTLHADLPIFPTYQNHVFSRWCISAQLAGSPGFLRSDITENPTCGRPTERSSIPNAKATARLDWGTGSGWQPCVTNIGGGIGGSVCVSIGLKQVIDSAVDEQDRPWKDSQPWHHLSKLLDFERFCRFILGWKGLCIQWRCEFGGAIGWISTYITRAACIDTRVVGPDVWSRGLGIKLNQLALPLPLALSIDGLPELPVARLGWILQFSQERDGESILLLGKHPRSVWR